MLLTRVFLFSFLVMDFFSVFAQAKEKPILTLNGFSAQFGTYNAKTNFIGSMEKFRSLTPESKLLDKNFDDYNQSFYNSYNENYGESASLFVTFDYNRSNGVWSKLNPQFRFGVSFASVDLFNGSISKTEYFRIDTLVSTQTGESSYVDSVASENYDLRYVSEMFLLDAHLLLSSNPERTWSFYGGIGLSMGFLMNPQATISYYSNDWIDSPANNNGLFFRDQLSKDESFSTNDFGFVALASIPLGLNFRLSKRKRVWENLNLFIEYRASLSYIDAPQLGGQMSTSGFNTFGVKYQME